MSLARFIQMGAAGVSGDTPFDPSSVADLEIWLDSSDTSYLFQDAAKVTAVTTNGDPVGCWADRSGNGYDHTVDSYNISKASYDSVDFLTKASGTGPNGIFFKPDGTKFFISDATSDVIRQYSLTSAWDITTASEGTTKDISAQDSATAEVFFKSDGTKMFVLGFTNNKVFEYDLSTAWDSSTASYNSVSFDFSSQETSARGLCFDPTGTKMYLSGQDTDAINQYGLSSAWDVSSASFTQSFSVTSQDTNPSGIFFTPDGTRMIISGNTNDNIYQYTLTVGFDISTASYDSVSFSVSSEMTGCQGLFLKNDGTKMYVIGFNNRRLRQYSTVANRPSYDTSTISGGSLFFDHTADSNYGEWLFNDTAKDTITAFFVVEVSSTQTGVLFGFDNSNNRYIHYDVGGVVYGTTPTSSFTNYNLNSYTGFPVNTTSLLSADINNFYRVNLTQYNPTTATNYTGGSPDGTWIGRRANAPTNNAPFRGNIAEVITYSRRLSSSEILQVEDYLKTKWSLNFGYNIAGASYVNKSFSILSEEATVQGMAFNNTGSKMYVIGSGSDKVHQYSLSTLFDASTASYDSVNFSVAAQETSPRSVTFNNTGSKMYIVGQTNDIVCQYTLSSQFDLSTASYDNVSLNVSSQESTPQGLTFNDDGSKMYILGNASDEIHQYSLSSLFDLSTASYDSVSFDVSGQATSPRRAVFNGDGTKMFVVGQTSDAVSQYSLSTPYIVSSASYDSVQFSVSGQDTMPRDVVFSSDGSKMYIVGNSNGAIFQYTTA